MKPIRLELEGFASFREHTEIDFEGADEFVLFGPTGAGKSSVLDGMVFALYGCVPRYEDKGSVAPTITQGRNEAKIRLDFSTNGKVYSALRIVRRTPGGATTAIAKLECEGVTLAENVKELDARVIELLRLNFDQFTRCVLLPQGEFARLLRDKPSLRQTLFRQLLNLQVYETISRRVQDRINTIEPSLVRVQTLLDRLGYATAEELRECKRRAAMLEKLQESVDSKCKEREKVNSAVLALKRVLHDRQSLTADLRKLKKPDGIELTSSTAAIATKQEAAAAENVLDLGKKLSAARSQLASVPILEDIGNNIRSHEQLLLKKKEQEVCKKASLEANAALGEVRRLLESAGQEVSTREAQLNAAKTSHAAHAIALALKPGDRCPVCSGLFSGSILEPSVAISDAQMTLNLAKARLTEVADQDKEKSKDAGIRDLELTKLGQEIKQLEQLLQDRPSLVLLKENLSAAESATSLCRALETQQEHAIEAQGKARRALQIASAAELQARTGLQKARERFLALGPPESSDVELAEAWRALEEWAATTVVTLTEKSEVDLGEVAGLEQVATQIEEEVLGMLITAGVEAGTRSLSQACIEESRAAKDKLLQVQKDFDEVATLKVESKDIKGRLAVARDLKKHLATNRFERWFLNRSFLRLCQTASVILFRLSGGQYSLSVNDQNDFDIIDHVNLEEKRSVRTLSGGETFLASLSLALALSQEIASASDGTGLDSLFLDEGFGTLDAETLETVSSTITELRTDGRMVGLITHVRELAERIPVRFEVRKGPRGSEVTKVAI